MSDFPRMVYRAGGPHEIHGGRFDYLIAEDAEELDAMLANGWHLTTTEAAAPVPAGDDAPPTRDELKQKATELGLIFAGNISTEKLAGLVAAALEG